MALPKSKVRRSDIKQAKVNTTSDIKIWIPLGTIQLLRHQRGGWGQKMAIFDDLQYCKSSKSWVGGPKKVKNMMT